MSQILQSHKDDPLEAALDLLRNAGYRITQPRVSILRTLLEATNPIKIEEIHGKVKHNHCDLATVYRCVATFEKAGIVRRCFFPDGSSRFEFIVGREHHHHIICTSCYNVETLDVCVVEGLERLVHDRGYTNITHLLEFFGVCSNCSAKAKTEEPERYSPENVGNRTG